MTEVVDVDDNDINHTYNRTVEIINCSIKLLLCPCMFKPADTEKLQKVNILNY